MNDAGAGEREPEPKEPARLHKQFDEVALPARGLSENPSALGTRA